MSNTDPKLCPEPNKPEYAFIGRSNVGKSSLINMLTGHSKLAKTSSTPGKTQLINHFVINNNWFLVDLPGYGYARVSKTSREKWSKFISGYLKNRKNLMCVFVLVDARHDPQKIDLEFMEWLGTNGIPFVICFTKMDKLNMKDKSKNVASYKKEMLKVWEELPTMFSTSSEKEMGKENVLQFIDETNQLW